MKLKIYEDRKVFLPTKKIGINNENKATTLELEYPEQYTTYTKTIEMQDGDWLVTDIIENDVYILKSNVTSHKNISAQIVFTDDDNNVVFKSEIFNIEFKDALNAVEPIDDTDALPSELIEGKKAYSKGEKITGTMPDNGELNYTPTTEEQIIPEGYTSGGIIGAVTSDIDENITPTNIRAGVTVLGVEGNLEPDKPDQSKTVTPTTQEQVIRADTGYELAQVTINPVTSAIDNNIQAGNIKKGVSILEVTGTYQGTDTSDATATAGDIAEGKTAYVDGEKLTGTGELVDWSDYLTDSIKEGSASAMADSGYIFSIKKLRFPSQVYGTSAYRMFASYPFIGIDVSNIDTSDVTNMSSMFTSCPRLTELDVSGLNTGNVTNMNSMFSSCNVLENLNVSNLNTSKVENMSYMFAYDRVLTELNVNSFDTGKVTNMSYMFAYCNELLNIDISGFNINKTTNMSSMFASNHKLTNDSLNSILKMLTTVSSLSSSSRTLKYIGLTSAQATTCTTLSNWADAQTVGWTTGY